MRGKKAIRQNIQPDSLYHNLLLAKFINTIMQRGKKTLAQSVVYRAFDLAKQNKNENPLTLFERVIEILRPSVEVRSRRVGGANYQVPVPVSNSRQNALAFRWLREAAKARAGKSMAEKLAAEILDVLSGTGGAVKKKEDVQRMAEANKAFAHFARFRR